VNKIKNSFLDGVPLRHASIIKRERALIRTSKTPSRESQRNSSSKLRVSNQKFKMSSQLEGGQTCIKYLVFIFNFLFFIIGCGLLGVGIFLKVGDDKFINVAESLSTISEYITLGNLMIAVGIIIVVVAFFGCCGAIKESQCMLTVFFTFLMLIFILELAGGIYGFINRDEIENQLKKDFQDAIKNKYNGTDNSAIDKTIDEFQKNFECCGYTNYVDWKDSKYFDKEKSIPKSCCKDVNNCNDSNDPTLFQSKGCFKEVVDWFKDNAYAAAACGIAFAALQVIGLIFSMCLICALKRAGTVA